MKNAEAAELLAVSVRTIKYWMTRQETREALGGVQCESQWRIPRPENPFAWKIQTSGRLRKLGFRINPPWKRELEKCGKRLDRYLLEGHRLRLAATMKVLERGNISQEDRDSIDCLWHEALEILAFQPGQEMEVDKLKCKFPAQLLRYWPEKKHFEHVRGARTLDELEAIRRNVDYAQAVCELERNDQKPTAENIRPLVHKDMIVHINDTRETLPDIVVKNQRSEELRMLTLASVYGQIVGKKPPPVSVDFRKPQDGLPLRSFRRRHPQTKNPQRDIVNVIYGVRDSLPGAYRGDSTTPTRLK